MKATDWLGRMPVILASATALALAACGNTTRASVTVDALKRTVIMEASGRVSFKNDGEEAAEFRTGGHTFRIEAERARVDGKEVFTFAKTCQEVTVTVRGTTYEIQAGKDDPFRGELK